ncbi:hypothetical protein SJ593_00925 [Citrobacter freundii]|uniref:DUF6056 family protein n=1 Tax=Citrobacter freundii TaxID=546 RepID=UPI001BCE87F4|nr:DUF6056 family protein [Citrobacter freundii]MDX7501455.1 hypothetical protein [Citrobacter freundii]
MKNRFIKTVMDIDARVLLRIFLILIFAYLLYNLSTAIHLLDFADDVYFKNAESKYSFVEFVTERYFTWSGRVLLEILAIYTFNYPVVWKIAIPLSLVIVSICIHQIALKGFIDKAISIPLILLSIIIYGPTIDSPGAAIWWVTGFYNYMLPFTLLFSSIAIFMRCNRRLSLLVSLMLAFLACNNEQAAVTGLLVGLAFVITSLITKKKLTCSLSFFVVCLLSFLLLYLAPGNIIRLHTEISNWMPEFSGFNIIDKSLIGIDLFRVNSLNYSNIAFISMLISNILISFRFSIEKNKLFIIPFVITSTYMLNIINCNILHLHMLEFAGSEQKININNIYTYANLAPILFFLSTIISIFITFLSIRSNVSNKLLFSAIFASSAATIVMLGMSPTIYASGPRVVYLSGLLTILFVANQIKIYIKS